MGSMLKNADREIEMTVIDSKNSLSTGTAKDNSKEEYDFVPAPPDGGYGWVIVGAAAVQSCICMGCVPAFGIFAVEFIQYFKASASSVSWIGSILLFMVAPAGFFVPPLLKKFSCRTLVIIGSFLLSGSFVLTSFAPNVPFLFFSMGILTGGSYPMIVLSGQVAIQSYFHKKKARALSISLSGPAIAIFIWPPIIRYFIDMYTWRGASLLLGGLNLNCIVSGALLRPAPMKRVPKVPGQIKAVQNEDRSLLMGSRCTIFSEKYLTRILMFCGWFGVHGGHTLVIVYTPITANFLRIDKTQGALLLSVVGIVGGSVRLVAGCIGDLKCVRRNALAGAFGIYCGILAFVSTSFETFEGLMVYSALYGVGAGFFVGLQGACVFDVVGLKNIATGYAITSCSFGFASLIAVSAAGYLYDLTGSPIGTVITVGTVQTIGGTCLCFIPIVQSYLQKRRESRQQKIIQIENSPVSNLKAQSALSCAHSVEHIGQPIS